MALDWAQRMRTIVILLVVAVLVVVIGATVFAFMYKVPSCADEVQNQDEAGVDCGGSCAYLCTAQVRAPTVLFSRALSAGAGRTDVIAVIQNQNKDAQAKRAPYVIELYAADATLLGKVPGFVDLPAGKAVPVFVRAAAGGSTVARVFISMDADAIRWEEAAMMDLPLKAQGATLIEGETPKLSATLINQGYESLHTIRAIAVIYDKDGTALAASETLVPSIRAQASVPIAFTWNAPFTTAAARFEILWSAPLP